MFKLKNFAFVILLVMVGFGCYKMGDKYGFEEGQRYGYGLDCRDDLENLKKVLNGMQSSLTSLEGSASRYASQLKDEEELRRARRYNELRPSLLKKFPNNAMLRAVKGYSEQGEPMIDEDFSRCMVGLGPCDKYPGFEEFGKKYEERLAKCREGKLSGKLCDALGGGK